jgi:hypothetical protein
MQNFGTTRSCYVWDANEEEGVVARYLRKTKITHFDIQIEEHYTFIHVQKPCDIVSITIIS